MLFISLPLSTGNHWGVCSDFQCFHVEDGENDGSQNKSAKVKPNSQLEVFKWLQYY